MQSATPIPYLTTGFGNMNLSSGTGIHNRSSKPDAGGGVQAAVRQSASLKRKFDGDNNKEEFHRPKKVTCGAKGPSKTERGVRRIMKLSRPRKLAFLASTNASAESRAELTKPGQPEMSLEEIQAAVQESSPLGNPLRLIYDINGNLLPYKSEDESTDGKSADRESADGEPTDGEPTDATDGESVYDRDDALYDTDDANNEEESTDEEESVDNEEESTDDEEESADDEKKFVDELRREFQFLGEDEAAEIVDEIRHMELQFLESTDEEQSANDKEGSTDNEEQSANDEEKYADDDVMMC